jgi:energy-coupling factor transporter transmembrane protein EcfT
LNAPVGTLQQASTTEDRVLYVYRRDRKLARGIVQMAVALLLVTAGFGLGLKLGTFWGWILSLLPLFVAAVAANWSLADLLRPTLFQLEVDHRARTLALSMAMVGGEALAKVRFDDAAAVEITGKGRAWNVTILLKVGRRMGLGLSEDPAKANEVAARFAGLLGVEVRPTRTPS